MKPKLDFVNATMIAVHGSKPPPASSLVTHDLLPRIAREGEITLIPDEEA